MLKKLALIFMLLFITATAHAGYYKYYDVVQDRSGRVISGATVEVVLTGTVTPATLYSNSTGSVLSASGIATTDSNGVYWFYASEDRYDITISKSGSTSQTRSDVTIGGQSGSFILTSGYSTLAAADTAAIGVSKSVTCDSTITTSTTTTIAAPFEPRKGCMLKKSGTITINFAGGIVGDPTFQWIDSDGADGFSAGDVTFASGTDIYAEWWGIDGTSDQTEVNIAIIAANAMAGGGIVKQGKAWAVDNSILLLSNVTLELRGAELPITSTVGAGIPTIKIGTPSSEYSNVKIINPWIIMTNANDTAIGIWKRSCGHFELTRGTLVGKENSQQIGVLWGNGTHSRWTQTRSENFKYPLYLDNPVTQECHDSIFDHPWLVPNNVAGAFGVWSGDYSSAGSQGKNAITFIYPYVEQGGALAGGYGSNGTTDPWTLIAPRLDGTFGAGNFAPGSTNNIWMIIAGGDEDYTFSADSLPRSFVQGKQILQIPQNVRLFNAGGNEQWSVTSTGMRIGTGAGTARIPRILTDDGTTTWDPGSLASGATTTTTITVNNADVGDIVSVGFTSITSAGWQISGQVTASTVVTVTLTNQTGGVVDLPQGTLRVVVYNAPTRLSQ